MTAREIEDKIFECHSRIADDVKNIQIHTNTIKVIEDEPKVMQAILKIEDMCADIKRSYALVEALEMEVPTDDDDDNMFLMDAMK